MITGSVLKRERTVTPTWSNHDYRKHIGEREPFHHPGSNTTTRREIEPSDQPSPNTPFDFFNMAQRVNDLLPHCLHQRNRNGVLLEQCIHCTQPVANTGTTQYTAQHTASLLGLGPDIDPFYGFEAAVERSFDAKERVQQRAYTHRPNTNSSGLQVNQQMQHNEAKESVDDMHNASNAFKAGSRTENWLHTVELDIQEESDERECAYSEYSLLRAINQDLQQGRPS